MLINSSVIFYGMYYSIFGALFRAQALEELIHWDGALS
jgi:hypothetical protein